MAFFRDIMILVIIHIIASQCDLIMYVSTS